jgi:hypothetical protein
MFNPACRAVSTNDSVLLTHSLCKSVRAGLRAKEISNIRWSMVTDAEGAVTDTIHLVNGASKGKRGGREIHRKLPQRQPGHTDEPVSRQAGT